MWYPMQIDEGAVLHPQRKRRLVTFSMDLAVKQVAKLVPVLSQFAPPPALTWQRMNPHFVGSHTKHKSQSANWCRARSSLAGCPRQLWLNWSIQPSISTLLRAIRVKPVEHPANCAHDPGKQTVYFGRRDILGPLGSWPSFMYTVVYA